MSLYHGYGGYKHPVKPREYPGEDFDIDYLSVEYLFERRWEASPVVFNIKSQIDEDFDFYTWDEDHNPRYAVHRLSMEPNRQGPTGGLRVQRLPDVVGRDPSELYEKIGHKPARREPFVPIFELATDSLAEFYLNLRLDKYDSDSQSRLRLSKWNGNFGERSLIQLISDLGTFNFHQPDTSKPYKYYDSRDFICQVYARLLSEGFLNDASVIQTDAPFGFRNKVETENQQHPYTNTSEINFSAVIGNLFYSGTERHSELHRDWDGDLVQGVYQPIIRGQFKKHDRQITLNYSKHMENKDKPWKEIVVPEKITFPYNKDESQIDRERSECARRIYQAYGLKTPFYQEALVAATTKPHKDITNGQNMGTQPCQHCGKVSTKAQPTTAASARTVPTTHDARAPGAKLNIQYSGGTSSLKGANTSASSSRSLASVTGRTRETENVPTLSTPVAAGRPTHAAASYVSSKRAPGSTSGHTTDARPSTRNTSSQAASIKPALGGGSAAKEGGNQQMANSSKKRATASGPETKKSVPVR